MRVEIITTDGSSVEVENFDPESLMEFIDRWKEGHTNVFQFDLGSGGMTFINPISIARVDVDTEVVE